MTSPTRHKCTTILACVAIVALLAVIVVVWVQFGNKGRSVNNPEKPVEHHHRTHQGNNFDEEKEDEPRKYLETSYLDGLGHPSDTEYVKPLKVSPLPLHDDDLLYDQLHNAQDQPTLRHHSGHFRHRLAEVWDPHPQYEIRAFGRDLRLVLAYNDKFVSPNLNIFHAWGNYTQRANHDPKLKGCFYTGAVEGDDGSDVAVSLCNGMTGYIHTSENSYYIEPAENFHATTTSSILHRIRKVAHNAPTTTNNNNNDVLESEEEGDNCDTPDDSAADRTVRNRRSASVGPDRHRWRDSARRKRTSGNEYVIEILVVADKSTADYHKTEETLHHYILTLMSHVLLLFKDASIGNAISVSVANIWVLKDKKFASGTSEEMLQKFCEWQRTYSLHQHDISLLLTRDTICKNASVPQTCNTLGVTEVGTMCNPQSNCAIAKDNGLSTSYSIAHELGHALGMPHDELKKCDKFFTGAKMKCIMSEKLQNDTKPIWSACSKHYLTEFLESPDKSKCLLDTTNEDYITPDFTTVLPGQNFEADKQCELEFGIGHKKCPYMPQCKNLWCTNNKNKGCKTQNMFWADGTSCDDRAERWCYRGECIAKRVLTPLAGGWGPWNDWGPCTRTCGGGIRKSHRVCNEPVPANGGDFCTGKSVRYESCNTRPCDADAPNFRERQCAEFNGNARGIRGLTNQVKWVPKYGANLPEEVCKLYCRVAQSSAHYLLKEKVVDGTKCGLNSFDICVNGICKPGGCDNALDSNRTLDDCGVCGGDNSKCEEISGTYNITSYGYNRVVVIPKGSSNVNVWQRGYQNDDNYLALVDAETGEYILNGKNMVSSRTKDVFYAGLTINYSGAEEAMERLTTPKNRKLTKDLVLTVLSVGALIPPDITYKYTINRESAPRYAWRVYAKEWSKCNSICSGTQHMTPVCVNLAANSLVGDKYCSHLDVESVTQKQECNTHCQLSWNVVYRGPCTGYCGQGLRELVYNCFRTEVVVTRFEPNHGSIVDDKHCNILPKPPRHEVCQGQCESMRWDYSDWSECSKSCGSGTQRRTGKCIDSEGRDIDETHCNRNEKITEQLCNTQKCPTWAFGDWTPCSVSCGRGYRTKPYYCHVDGRIYNRQACNADDLHPSSVREECFEKSCVRWHSGAWNECSVSCATGTQRREISCVTIGSEMVVDDGLCRGLLRPNDSKTCVAGDCPTFKHRSVYDDNVQDNSISVATASSSSRFRWIMGAWGQCSKTCGSGAMSRVVVCRNAFGEELEYMCDHSDRPIDSVGCNTQACPEWSVGAWSECGGDCEQHRQVSCQSAFQRCDPLKKPPSSMKCESCASVKRYEWKTGKWTRCSNSCGKGSRTRQVFCRDVVKDVTVVDLYCNVVRRPKGNRACVRNNCEFTWIEGEWSQCSSSCDRGVKRRNVTCHKVLIGGYVDPTPVPEPYYKIHFRNFCDLYNRPAESSECVERNCADSYSWSLGPWQECSHPCGKKGRQIRKLFCVNTEGKKVQRYLCPKSLRPPRKQKCNQKKCLYRNCKDVKKALKTTQNKDYLLSINGQPALVYCYKMDTPEPEEFISFQVNTQNYAEIFDKRLRDVNTCPNDGQRTDDCDCTPVGSDRSGFTKFWKARLNVTSLRIVNDDYTFSSQTKGKRVPYGTAGDCYSQVRGCPQGRFSVDLTGTSFKLSKRTNWVSRGRQASTHINAQERTVMGRCGGYCGNCEPDPDVGIAVEVY